jgi:multidrug efflux pump subunit AcrA (membrane-fusion protein)
MSRALQPEPEDPATTAAEDDARTAPATTPPAVDRARGRVQHLRKPYVLVPALVVVAVVVGLGMGALGDGGTVSSPTSQVATATRGSMSETVGAEGTVAAAQTNDLSFSSSGTVTAVDVKAGDEVKAGQVLATIDSAALGADVAAAQSSLAQAQAQLGDDQSSGASAQRVAADEASLAAANDQLTSAQSALNGASLVATFDGVVSQVNVTAGEQLASGGTGGTSATGSGTGSGSSSASNGSQSSGGNGSNSGNGGNGGNGRTPGSTGSSSSSNSSSSNSSSSSQPDVQVVSKDSYVVQLPVASADVDSVKVGQAATLTVTASSSSGGAAGGGRFPTGLFPGAGGNNGQRANGGNGQGGNGQGGNRQGANGQGSTAQRGSGQGGSGAASSTASATGKVTDVAQVATATSGVAQYPVTVTFTAGSHQIFVGSTVTGAIETSTRNNVLQVPARAVTTTNGASTVKVRQDGRTESRTVKTGLSANGMVEITDGLKEGDQVVIDLPAAFGGSGGGTAPGGGNRPSVVAPGGSTSGSTP